MKKTAVTAHKTHAAGDLQVELPLSEGMFLVVRSELLGSIHSPVTDLLCN